MSGGDMRALAGQREADEAARRLVEPRLVMRAGAPHGKPELCILPDGRTALLIDRLDQLPQYAAVPLMVELLRDTARVLHVMYLGWPEAVQLRRRIDECLSELGSPTAASALWLRRQPTGERA